MQLGGLAQAAGEYTEAHQYAIPQPFPQPVPRPDSPQPFPQPVPLSTARSTAGASFHSSLTLPSLPRGRYFHKALDEARGQEDTAAADLARVSLGLADGHRAFDEFLSANAQ